MFNSSVVVFSPIPLFSDRDNKVGLTLSLTEWVKKAIYGGQVRWQLQSKMILVEEAQEVSKSQIAGTWRKLWEKDCSVIVLLPHLFPKKLLLATASERTEEDVWFNPL